MTMRKAFRSGKSSNQMWGNFRSHFGNAAVDTLEFALSPAENSACNGFADDQFTKSATLTKTDVATSFPCPDIFKTSSPNSTWSLTLVMLPSVDTPLLSIAINDDLVTDTIPWGCLESCGQSDVAGYISNVHRFSDCRGELVQPATYTAAGLNLPSSIQAGAWTENNKRFVVYETSNQDQTVASSRLCGMSLTSYLSANSTQNKGTVYSTQLTQLADPKSVNFPTTSFDAAEVNQTPALYNKDVISANTNVLTGLPGSINELDQSGLYVGEAYDGNYTVAKFMGNTCAKSIYDHRAILGFQDPAKPKTVDSPICVRNKAHISSFDGSQPTVEAYVIEMLALDRSFTPILVHYANLDQSATVKLKMVMGIEFTAVPNSSYHYLMHPALDMCAEYCMLLKGLSAKLPPGAPKSANDFWTTFKSIAATLLSVVSHVAPVLLPLLV